MSLHNSFYAAAAAFCESLYGGSVRVLTDGKQRSVTSTVFPEATERRRNRDGGIDLVTTRVISSAEVIATNSVVLIDSVRYGVESHELAADGRFYTKLIRVSAAEVSRNTYRR